MATLGKGRPMCGRRLFAATIICLTMTELSPCAICGKPHPIADIELTFRRPDDYARIPSEERHVKAQSTDDLCAIWGDTEDTHRYFVRCLLPLPVAEWSEAYALGVWVEVARVAFDRIRELWDEPEQAREPAIAATLANTVPFHAPTCGLPGLLRLSGPDTRPQFALDATDNSLFTEQNAGISAHRASEYTGLLG
jgi:hypothetical protein